MNDALITDYSLHHSSALQLFSSTFSFLRRVLLHWRFIMLANTMRTFAALPEAHLQRLVLENVSDIIIITDLHFKVQFWNPIAERFYGIPAAAAIGRSMNDLVRFTFHNTTQEEALHVLLAQKLWQGEISFTSATGEGFYLFQTVKYITDSAGNDVGIMAVGRNITDCKRAERQLAQSEKFYRSLISHSLDVVLLINHRGIITFASPSIKNLLGYEPEEALGTSGFGYIHPDDLKWAQQAFFKEVEENPDVKFILIRLRKKSGDWLWCMARGNNMLHTPHVNAVAVYIHDDTPRKQATDALRRSEKHFRSLIRDLQVGVLLQDPEGKVLLTNNAMTRILGMKEEEIAGGKIWEHYPSVVHEDGRPFALEERPSYKASQTLCLVKDVVMGLRHKTTGKEIWIVVSADPVMDAEGALRNIVCSFTDITEGKKRERKATAKKIAHQRQLAQATIDGQEQERLEVGRELHDNIGQQLTSIKLVLDVAKTAAGNEAACLISTALKSVMNVIDDVRTMSRSLVPPTLKDLGLIDSINDLLESLRTAQTLKLSFQHDGFDEDSLAENKKLALYRIVQEQLNNVLKYACAQNVCIRLSNEDEHVRLQLTDDGVGFDLHNVRRGLGLTNIANRSELFGGRTQINTAPGKGCTLNVWLPKDEGGGKKAEGGGQKRVKSEWQAVNSE